MFFEPTEFHVIAKKQNQFFKEKKPPWDLMKLF